MCRKYLTLILILALFLGAGPAMAADSSSPDGHQQIVDAFDAAWTRIIRSGQYRAIINNFQEPIPGVIEAQDYIINQSDCLPNPDVTPFPAKPKGRFKEILNNEEIRQGSVLGAPWFISGGRNVADWFSGGFGGSDMSADMLDAILAEIAAHYGTGPIAITQIEIPFPFNTTSALQDGIFGFSVNVFSAQYPPFQPVQLPGVTVDFLDQFNAKGGESEELRRLKGRRPTCTLSSSGQYIHVPVGSLFTINNIDDLRADTSIRICSGNLSTQLANQYFPDHTVVTKRSWDIQECYEDLRDGLSDVMIFSLPVLPTALQVGAPGGPALQPSVNTNIVAGTPYWTRQKDIKCEGVASPPFPPGLPFGTFRECSTK